MPPIISSKNLENLKKSTEKESTPIKLLQKKKMESDFSTEGSDEEEGVLKMNLKSYSLNISPKENPKKENKNKILTKDNCNTLFTKDEYSTLSEPDTSTESSKSTKKLKNSKKISGQEATIVKPKRRFNNKTEK